MAMTPEDAARYTKHTMIAESRRARARHHGGTSPGAVASLTLLVDGSALFSCPDVFEESTLLDAMEAAIIERRTELAEPLSLESDS